MADCPGASVRTKASRVLGMTRLTSERRCCGRVLAVATVFVLGPLPAVFGKAGGGGSGQAQEFADAGRIDRVLAVVNGEPITLSEVLEAVALTPGILAPPLQDTLERLIDARLMEHEARRYPQEPPSEEESEATLRALTDRFATPDDYRATLRRLGVAEDYLRKRIQRELIVDRYVDRRFRPLVQVAQREVEEYYRTVLLPDLVEAGSPASLGDVESLIRNILEQRDLNRRISAWVDELKSGASIVRLALSELPPAD